LRWVNLEPGEDLWRRKKPVLVLARRWSEGLVLAPNYLLGDCRWRPVGGLAGSCKEGWKDGHWRVRGESGS
jgi:hypothetical protein